MPDNVSPGCTTYLAAGRFPVIDAAATLSALARVTSVVLLAMRMFAWAWRTDPFAPTITTMISGMHQASMTHADFVHIRTVLSLSFQGDQRRTLQVLTPKARTGREGKDLSWRHLRQVRPPYRHRGGTTRQPQQDQHEQRDQGSTDATLHPAPAAPADAAARAAGAVCAVRAATRRSRQPGKRRQRRTAATRPRRHRPRGHTSAQRSSRHAPGLKRPGHTPPADAGNRAHHR